MDGMIFHLFLMGIDFCCFSISYTDKHMYVPCRKIIQSFQQLLQVIESSMYTWELMYLEGALSVVDNGMYV